VAAASSDILIDAPAGEPVLHLTRWLDAPRALVWETFTRPEHVARWWGPRKYTVDVQEFDVRPGGKWRIAHRDDTKTVTFFGEYIEVVKPQRLVRTFCFGQFPPIEETFAFHDEGARTRLVSSQRYPDLAVRDWMAKSGAAEGGRESFERLDELLRSLA
jgi:uncharacterized protein YndB with AHSA1/START domain